MIDFFIPCIPPKSTHQAAQRILRRRDGTQFIGKFATSKGKQVEGELMMLFAPHRPLTPMQGPLSLSVKWNYPWRKSEKKVNRARGWMPCDVRPDCDNLAKFVCDILTRLAFYDDDGQVADLNFLKGWSDKIGIGIRIESLADLIGEGK